MCRRGGAGLGSLFALQQRLVIRDRQLPLRNLEHGPYQGAHHLAQKSIGLNLKPYKRFVT